MSLRKKKWFGAGVAVLLLAALMAAVFLTKNRQELRRGAYFAGTDVLLVPEEVEKRVGEEFPIGLMVETKQVNGGELAKVDFVQTKLCFGPEVAAEGKVEEKIILAEDFTDLMKVGVENGCLGLAVKAEKPGIELGSGLVRVATIRFRAVKAGAGKIRIDAGATRISGYNPDKESRDMALELGKPGEVNYRIGGAEGGEKKCGWWNLVCRLKSRRVP